MSPHNHDSDEQLLTRLRDLSLVELDALLSGVTGQHYAELLSSHSEQLVDALSAARRRSLELLSIATKGPDPLNLLDAPFEMRARDGGRDAVARVVDRLSVRSEASRALARLDDLISCLFPHLLEADRRRASL